MTDNKIPERAQIPAEYTWELSDIFRTDGDWQKAMEEADGLKERFAAFQGRLSESADTLLQFFRLDDEAGLLLERIYTYANCKSDQDTADSFYRDMRGRAMGVYVEISSAASFAKPEIIAIDEERLNSFYAQQPALEEYRRSIYKMCRQAQHSLSAAEERLLSAAGEMADAPDNICSVLRNAELRFEPVADGQGQLHPLSNEQLVVLLESGDRILRKNAGKESLPF